MGDNFVRINPGSDLRTVVKEIMAYLIMVGIMLSQLIFNAIRIFCETPN